MTWVTPRTWVTSEVVTAAIMNQHVRDNLLAAQDRIQEVYKLTDEIVNNSAVLQDDNELFFTVVAGQKYLFTLNLIIVAASNAPDFLPAFTFPTGTLNWTGIGLDTAATSAIASVRISGIAPATTGVAGPAFGAVSASTGLLINGSYSCTTGGTVRLQWAQSVATASDTTVKAGSSIQAIRVAV